MLRKTVDFRSPIPPQSTPCRTRRSSSRREWRQGHAPPARRRSCGRLAGPGGAPPSEDSCLGGGAETGFVFCVDIVLLPASFPLLPGRPFLRTPVL